MPGKVLRTARNVVLASISVCGTLCSNLVWEVMNAETTTLDFPDLIRTGSEQGLLQNSWDVWKSYRKARGTTSHTFNEEKAREVLAVVPDFLNEARYLFSQLQNRAGGAGGKNA